MKIDNCPHCNSTDFEDCDTIRDPTMQQYFCNGCKGYFSVYDLMP